MHVLVVKRVARFHALAELAECRHPHPRSPIEIFIDRIVGKHLSRYQSVHHAVHCAGMPSLRIRWFMCNVNYACKLFLGPFCLSAIPHRRCWWMRPAQLHTHKGTIIMRLLVVRRWVCVCLDRASSIFPYATLFSIHLRWWEAIHMHTRPQATTSTIQTFLSRAKVAVYVEPEGCQRAAQCAPCKCQWWTRNTNSLR